MTNFINYSIFSGFAELRAFTTTKKSIDIQHPRFTGDNPALFSDSRKQLATKLGIQPEQLVFPRQTHGNGVVEIQNISPKEWSDTDALISNQPGICICVQTADCVPILLFDKKNRVISVVHAGWRGTAKRIVEKTVLKMQKNYGSQPENILAAIGPSIGIQNYEVGDEVISEIRKNIPCAEQTFQQTKPGKYQLNLWEANRFILKEKGISDKNIQVFGECSFALTNKYFSARRDGIETGRMVSGMILR